MLRYCEFRIFICLDYLARKTNVFIFSLSFVSINCLSRAFNYFFFFNAHLNVFELKSFKMLMMKIIIYFERIVYIYRRILEQVKVLFSYIPFTISTISYLRKYNILNEKCLLVTMFLWKKVYFFNNNIFFFFVKINFFWNLIHPKLFFGTIRKYLVYGNILKIFNSKVLENSQKSP